MFDDAPAARALIRGKFEQASQRDLLRLHRILPFAAYFGEHELCVSAFRRVARHLIGIYIVGFWHPLYAEMRKLPAFKELVKEVGLLTYWQATGEWGEFARPVGHDDFVCW